MNSAPAFSGLDDAVAFINRGHAVFPIKPDYKEPIPKAWQEVATRDPIKAAKWWLQNESANVALVCGKYEGGYLAILDNDPRNGDGWQKLCADVGLTAANLKTFTVATPSGGAHYYFRTAQPLAKKALKTVGYPGVDLQAAGSNCYVLCAGHTIEVRENGRVKQSEGNYRIVDASPVADMPPALLARLSHLFVSDKPKTQAAPIVATPSDVDQNIAAAQARAWLEAQEPVQDGDRNNTGYAVAAKVRQFGAADPNACFDLLRTYWKCEPPLDDAELMHVCRSAYRYAQEPAGSLSPEALFDKLHDAPKDEPAVAPATMDDASQKVPAKDKTVDFWTAADVTTPDKIFDDYLIKGWLWKQTDAQMFGATNIGKTFVALDMALHIAAGQPWFGCNVQQIGVMYLAFEGQKGLRLARVPALKRKYSALDWNKLPLMVVNCNAPLVDAKAQPKDTAGWVYLQQAIAGFKERYGAAPGLIIVDTYSRAIGGDTSDETLAIKFSQMAGSLLRDHGATVLRIHHPGHTNVGRAKGSSSIRQGVDSDINVSAGLIEAPKQRDAKATRLGFALETVTVAVDQDGEPLTTCVVNQAVIAADPGLNDRQNGILETVRSLADRDGKAKRAAVYKASYDEGFIASRGAFRDALVALEKKQRIKFGRDVIQLHLTFDNLDTDDA